MVPLTIFGSFGQILSPAPCLADRSLVGCLKSPTRNISKCGKVCGISLIARAGTPPRISDHDEYEVDYQFDIGSRPLFLFGAKDDDKARLATISCLEFQRRGIPLKGVIVNQDFEGGITKKDRTSITSASDKPFPSLDDFRENGPQFFERERPA